MKKYLLYIVVIVVIAVAAWILWNREEPFTVENNLAGKEDVALLTEVYPLYQEAKWKEPAEVSPGEFKIESEPFTDVTNIAEITTPFTDYYQQQLKADGWEQDLMREASGPGANVSYYTKGNRYIVIGFASDFKVESDSAPSQCPCDVTLSIVSGQE